MGILDQFKTASSMLKNMSPDQIQQLMEQAKESQKMLDGQIRKIVDEEIKRRGLVSRDEVEQMLRNH